MQMSVGVLIFSMHRRRFSITLGLCGDILSVLRLSHSGLSCLSTPSPVWPRFRGTDVNHWFAISKVNNPTCIWWSWPVWIWIGCRSTSSCRVFHLMMNNFFSVENDPVLTVNCVFLSVHNESAPYLRLEFNSEDVLPSSRVLRFQSQHSELGVNEEQPEDGHAQSTRHKSTSIHREGHTQHCNLTAAIIRH